MEDAWLAVEQADKEKDVDDIKKVRSLFRGWADLPHLYNCLYDAANAC